MTARWGPARMVPGGFATLKVSQGPLAEALADELADRLKARQAAGESLRLGLSGGTTPAKAYRRLGQADLPWDQIHLGFGDERVGPQQGEGSNWAMARAAFGEPACGLAHWRAFEDSEAEEAHLKEAGPYPLLLLGLGKDGHTASLFAGQPALHERGRLVMDAHGPGPWHERRTLTPKAIAEAGTVFVAIEGEAKAPVLALLWSGEPLALSQALAGRDPAHTFLLVDAEAAHALP